MTKWYATITNRKSGKQITVGEYSENNLRKTISNMIKMGMVDDSWCFDIYTVSI